ncbi:hypothetical protein JTE90_005136 [Oedothorax gibbosus]|uniref:Uncharacterized protein n=1 Tax=Oedothorax gibbosus TaxID=931172 RepID=A0AAV6ULQ7_9ARAC|nr:hypothetical protein JTE90_005136 [Oedothorax gibbosus]
MRIQSLIGVLAVAVVLFCCTSQVEGFGKIKVLRLLKAGLILKALSPSKILLPLPIPIPIRIKGHDSHSFGGHHGGFHGGYAPHGGFHGGYSAHHFGGGHHGGGFGFHGYHLQAGHHIF